MRDSALHLNHHKHEQIKIRKLEKVMYYARPSIWNANHPSRPRHLPEDQKQQLARKQPAGKIDARQTFAINCSVSTAANQADYNNYGKGGLEGCEKKI